MKFGEFKSTPPEPPPPQIELFDSGGRYLHGRPSGFNDEDEIIRLKLAWGNCPQCGYRTDSENVAKAIGLMRHTCTQDPLHMWEIDYVNHSITRF